MSATEEVERRNKQKNEALASMTKEEMEKYNEAFQVGAINSKFQKL